MHYLQRIEETETRFFTGDRSFTFDRFMVADYMGSAEFEFGTYGAALRSMREATLQINKFSVNENGKTVDFWSISTEDGFKKLTEVMPSLANGKRRTKEYTGIEGYFYDFRFSEETKGWLVVDNFINISSNKDTAVFFTTSKKLAAQFYCELLRTKDGDKTSVFDIRMFDEVYVAGHSLPGKVCGILENGSYSVKFLNKKTIKAALPDIWPSDKFPLDKLKEFELI